MTISLLYPCLQVRFPNPTIGGGIMYFEGTNDKAHPNGTRFMILRARNSPMAKPTCADTSPDTERGTNDKIHENK